LQISRQATHKLLKRLIEQGKLIKIGQPPRVFYSINKNPLKIERKKLLDTKIEAFIEKNYLYISPLGETHKGVDGFQKWCEARNQNFQKQAEDYVKLSNAINNLRKSGLLNGTAKMVGTFEQCYLDQVFYLDFYSIERFGKTKLGQMLLYAKQSQNKAMIRELVAEIKPQIDRLVKEKKIDAVGFIPPTVKREVQFMKELRKDLGLSVTNFAIEKVDTPIKIPQKTLSKLEDRIINASNTLIVTEKRKFKNILLIDDAVGSGATLNQVARKIREQALVTGKIIGLAITGSYKGFDVISEV